MSEQLGNLNMRMDIITNEILKALVKTTGDKKSKVVRDALEYYAAHVIGQEELLNIRLYKHFDN